MDKKQLIIDYLTQVGGAELYANRNTVRQVWKKTPYVLTIKRFDNGKVRAIPSEDHKVGQSLQIYVYDFTYATDLFYMDEREVFDDVLEKSVAKVYPSLEEFDYSAITDDDFITRFKIQSKPFEYYKGKED